VAVEPDGRVVVVDLVLQAAVRIDPTTGERSIASGCSTIDACTDTIGHGPVLLSPWDIAVGTDGALVVVDAFANAVVRMDPRSGDRTLVSDASTGSGLPFGGPVGLAVEANGALVIVDGALAAVLRVDQVGGDRTVVSRVSTGGGFALGSPVGIAVEADGHFVIADSLLAAVVRVDPRSGDRTLVSGCTDADCTQTIGSGPSLGSPVGIAVEASGALVVVDNALSAVVRVDPRNGSRTLVSGCKNSDCTDTIGSGLPFLSLRALAVARDGHLVVVDDRLNAVVRVDPVTGNRSLISGQGRGSGPSPPDLLGIAVEATGALVTVSSSVVGVLRVDPVTGRHHRASQWGPASGGRGSPRGGAGGPHDR
jgi:streptogramin lyase